MSEKTEVKPEKTLNELIAEAVREAIPAAALAISAVTAAKAPAPPPSKEKCGLCGQSVTGCKNEHVQMVAYPKTPLTFPEHFMGVTINGVTYRSPNAGFKITVPKAIEENITSMIERWAEAETVNLQGRKHMYRLG
jgi:hypothetical protein